MSFVLGSLDALGPGVGAARTPTAGRSGDLRRERGGAHLSFVLELEEEAVPAGRRELGGEGHRAPRTPGRAIVERVDVEVGEIPLAQRHQMAAGAQVG